jgi:hypothetical protein
MIQEKEGNVFDRKKEMEILHNDILVKRTQTYFNSADHQLQHLTFIHSLAI